MKTLKLGLITNIHREADSNSNRIDKALTVLEAFVSEMNQRKADLVIDLGDKICTSDKQTNRELERDVGAIFKQLSMPHIHLFGNHDLEHFSKEDNAIFLGTSVAPQSLDINGYHLVFWQVDAKASEGFIVTEEQLAWLTKDLKETLAPSLLFTHVPFSKAPMTGNYSFESHPKYHAKHKNTYAFRSIIEASNVIASIVGNVQFNSLNSIRGVHHITLQSLTESFSTAGETAGSWAWLELSDSLKIEFKGKDSFKLRLPIRINSQNYLEAIAWSLRP